MQKLRAERGITLIALIITIIVMLILVGVTVTVSLNGGLFATAKQAATKTQIEGDREQLFTAAIGAIGTDGKVNYEKLNNNLPQGFTESNGTYISKEGNNYIVEENGNVKYIETIEELQEKHQFEYYSTLSGAVADVNAETIGTNADADKEEAVAGIYVEDGNTTVVLLKDTTEDAKIVVKKDMTINLGGNTLTVNAAVGIDGFSNNTDTITIDGRLSGSSINVTGSDKGGRVIQTKSNSFIINGGAYSLSALPESSNVSFSAFNVSAGGKLSIKSSSILVYADTNAQCSMIVGFAVYSEGELSIRNCAIKVLASTSCNAHRRNGFC